MSPVLLLCLLGGTLFTALWLWIFRERIDIPKWAIPPAAILFTIAGLICVSLLAGLESFQLTLSDGRRLYGAIFFMPLFYWATAKIFSRDPKQVFDVATLCGITSLLLVRIGCIESGCCKGLPLPGSSGLRWPIREAEMLFHGALAVFFYHRLRRQEQPGTNYPLYMVLYGAFRFIIEWLREEYNPFLGGLHLAHFWSLLSIIIGGSIYLEYRERERRGAARARVRRKRK